MSDRPVDYSAPNSQEDPNSDSKEIARLKDHLQLVSDDNKGLLDILDNILSSANTKLKKAVHKKLDERSAPAITKEANDAIKRVEAAQAYIDMLPIKKYGMFSGRLKKVRTRCLQAYENYKTNLELYQDKIKKFKESGGFARVTKAMIDKRQANGGLVHVISAYYMQQKRESGNPQVPQFVRYTPSKGKPGAGSLERITEEDVNDLVGKPDTRVFRGKIVPASNGKKKLEYHEITKT